MDNDTLIAKLEWEGNDYALTDGNPETDLEDRATAELLEAAQAAWHAFTRHLGI